MIVSSEISPLDFKQFSIISVSLVAISCENIISTSGSVEIFKKSLTNISNLSKPLENSCSNLSDFNSKPLNKNLRATPLGALPNLSISLLTDCEYS